MTENSTKKPSFEGVYSNCLADPERVKAAGLSDGTRAALFLKAKYENLMHCIIEYQDLALLGNQDKLTDELLAAGEPLKAYIDSLVLGAINESICFRDWKDF
jgi:hypothetical protein